MISTVAFRCVILKYRGVSVKTIVATLHSTHWWTIAVRERDMESVYVCAHIAHITLNAPLAPTVSTKHTKYRRAYDHRTVWYAKRFTVPIQTHTHQLFKCVYFIHAAICLMNFCWMLIFFFFSRLLLPRSPQFLCNLVPNVINKW